MRREPARICKFVLQGQAPRTIALVAGLTALELKTRLPQVFYTLRGIDPMNIRLFIDSREIPDNEIIVRVVPDGATIRVEVRKRR